MRSGPLQTILRVLGPAEVSDALDFESLIEALRQVLRSGGGMPAEQVYPIPLLGGEAGKLFVTPAWQTGRHIGVKILTSFPAQEKTAASLGTYVLLDAKTGRPLIIMDGPMLTQRRTAAASALAAKYLARPDAARLLMVGTGSLASHLIEAHATVRPIKTVTVWGRDHVKARKLAQRLDRRSLTVTAAPDLADAVHNADIICCATAAAEPLIKGHWLMLGTHLDLVGGMTPEMREVDDAVIKRVRVFVDTREGTLQQAGDIVQPIKSGALHEDDIAGDLFELTRGSRAGRRYYDQITLFKSVGIGLEDLAAAQLALERATT